MKAPRNTLTVEQFGAELLKTKDLDPVYVALANTKLPRSQVKRLCLAYWCFYHLGAAACMSEHQGPHFWHLMGVAAANNTEPRWPRGAERRHFRGQQAINAVKDLCNRYLHPEDAVDAMTLTGAKKRTFEDVAKSVQTHTGFGPWIAFKIADMTDRVLRLPVDFSNCHLGIYKDPRQGAALARHFRYGGKGEGQPWAAPITDEAVVEEYNYWVGYWSKRAKAPPFDDRPVNIQEVETIMCKWKSHYKGSYPLNKDTRELLHALNDDRWGRTAARLQKALL